MSVPNEWERLGGPLEIKSGDGHAGLSPTMHFGGKSATNLSNAAITTNAPTIARPAIAVLFFLSRRHASAHWLTPLGRVGNCSILWDISLPNLRSELFQSNSRVDVSVGDICDKICNEGHQRDYHHDSLDDRKVQLSGGFYELSSYSWPVENGLGDRRPRQQASKIEAHVRDDWNQSIAKPVSVDHSSVP